MGESYKEEKKIKNIFATMFKFRSPTIKSKNFILQFPFQYLLSNNSEHFDMYIDIYKNINKYELKNSMGKTSIGRPGAFSMVLGKE